MKPCFLFLFISSLFYSCQSQINTETSVKLPPISQDSIIERYLKKGAYQHQLYSQEWQEEIDKGLAIDSTVAYLWQQKAMPLFKQGKYELGMQYIDKAVIYDRAEWQEYRAFIKCIFAKTYKAAIADFEDCKKRYGNNHVMDHTYNFYIAISHLQLNNFKKAEELLKQEIDAAFQERGEEWVHHLDLFYYGVSVYEQKRYEEAIEIFDRALNAYPNFSDVQYYKAYSLMNLDKKEEAKKLYSEAKENGLAGYTINEDNVAYERYPYQVRWN